MSLQAIVNEMLDKGLIEIAKTAGVHTANRLYQQLTILNYTTLQTVVPDTYTTFLREHRGN